MKAKYLFATGLMASVSHIAMAETCSTDFGGTLSSGVCTIDSSSLALDPSGSNSFTTSTTSTPSVSVNGTAQSVDDATGIIFNGDMTFGAGNDTVSLTGSNQNLTVEGNLNFGSDGGNGAVNTLNLNSAVINGYVSVGDSGPSPVDGNGILQSQDIIDLTNAVIDGNGSAANTVIDFYAIDFTDAANGGASAARQSVFLSLKDSEITGNVALGGGVDTVYLGKDAAFGDILGTLSTGSGADTIGLYGASSIDGSSTTGGIPGLAVELGGGNGDKLSLFDNSVILGDVRTSSKFNSTTGIYETATVTLSGNSQIQGNIEGDAGIDSIQNVGNSQIIGNINTGSGADTIVVGNPGGTGLNAKIIGNIDMGLTPETDTFSVNAGGYVKGNVKMWAGDDIAILYSKHEGDLDTGSDNDRITLRGTGTVEGTFGQSTGLINAGSGDDTIRILQAGQSQGSIDAGAGVDLLQLGFLDETKHTGSVNIANMGSGDDRVIAFDDTTATSIDTGADNDRVYLFQQAAIDTITTGDDEDLVTLGVTKYAVADSASVMQNVITQEKYDEITNGAPSTATLTNLDTGADNDIVEVASETKITNNLLTGTGEDNVLVTDKGFVKTIDMGADNDIALVNLNASVTTLGGGAGDDEITVTDNATVANVNGGDGIDTLLVSINAKVTGTADLGAGDDIVTVMNNATLANTLTGTGDDVMTVNDTSTIGPVNMGDGSDTLTLNGSGIKITGTLDGGDDTTEADGFIDRLVFSGWTGATAEEYATLPSVDYINWEYMTLENSKMFVDGPTELTVGTLEVNGNSTLKIDTSDPSEFTVNGNLDNKGIIDMSNGAIGGGLTTTGDYTGNGTLVMDINLGTEESDLLVVGGDVNANGQLDFKRIGNDTAGDSTTRIKVVDAVNDDKGTASVFTFDSTIQGSSKAWRLYDQEDGFYVGYDVATPPPPPPPPEVPVLVEVPALVMVPSIARDVTDLRNLHDRLGEIRRLEGWVGTGPHSLETHMGTEWSNIYSYIPRDFNLWVKGSMGGSQSNGKKAYGYDGMYGGIDAGMDVKLELDTHDVAYAGLYGGYRDGSYTVDGTTEVAEWDNAVDNRDSDVDISSWHVGGYLTYLWRRTSYIDLVAQYAQIDADVSTDTFEKRDGNAITRYMGYNGSLSGEAFSASAEFGHRIDLEDDLILEPQAQLIYTYMGFDDHNRMENGEVLYKATYEDAHYATARLGLRLEKTFEISENSEFKPWIRASYLQEIGDTPTVTVGNDNYTSYDLDGYGELNVGATFVVSDTVQLQAGVNYRSDFYDYHAYDGNIGLRVSW